MAALGGGRQIVVVAGDVTMDWNLARKRKSDRPTAVWSAEDTTETYWQRGGAALLADLIEAATTDVPGVVLHQVGAPKDGAVPGDGRFHHSYALWKRFGDDQAKPDTVPAPGDPGPAWRVEEFLGFDRGPTTGPDASATWKRVVDDPPQAALVVLDDADLGLRQHRELWPAALAGAGNDAPPEARPWILLKMAKPVAQGDLWDALQSCTERLVVVITINDLRLTEVQVSRELSWERTAQDLAWELVHNPRVNTLSRCPHVVVSFGTAGALLLTPLPQTSATAQPPAKCTLFFDPETMEGSWAQQHPGGMIGYTTCLTASLARELVRQPENPRIEQAVQRGLAAMRFLHLQGYGARDPNARRARLEFPCRLVADELRKDGRPFVEQSVEDPARALVAPANAEATAAGYWTILRDRYSSGFETVAEEIALNGADAALEGVPLGRFGKLLTVDRQEIESFRAIRALVSEYARQRRPARPLSIAVFGPPGSGKSFGVKQVVGAALPDRIKELTFNLSQLDGPSDLLDAFHQVRDQALKEKLPLVFWDEFDSKLNSEELGWLRHFLSPMQDGSFQEEQLVHPIGPAIFVFAGGTSATMEEFERDATKHDAAKGPDFVSRLKGYVDIRGPNPCPNPARDPDYLIRRAILLRSMLRDSHPHLFQPNDGYDTLSIDPGVLRAFVRTRRYKHGARSMESIVAMSRLANRSKFERSALPADDQLGLHVDTQDFVALVRELQLEPEILERLAEANHVVYCAAMLGSGHRWGESDDAYLRVHPLLEDFAGPRSQEGRPWTTLVPYARLPEEVKGQNRDAALDIANKLAAANYVMRPARSDEKRFDFPGPELETLAEIEHDRWMKKKLADGWRYGENRDNVRLLHPDLRPWAKLSDEERVARYGAEDAPNLGDGELTDEEREKDREAIRGIPDVLAAVGYTVVKIEPDERPDET